PRDRFSGALPGNRRAGAAHREGIQDHRRGGRDADAPRPQDPLRAQREGDMKRYDTQDIRNVTFVGHGGSGKTSLAEAILFDAKGTTRLGVAGTDSSNFDYEPEEVKRGGSIQVSVGYVEWQKKKINFIDSPGDQNFLVETRVAMQIAADAAVVVVS